MRPRQIVPLLLSVAIVLIPLGGHSASAQSVRVEAGGGWAIPSSDIRMTGEGQGDIQVATTVDPGSGPHAYVAGGLVWTVSENFALEARLRAQQSQMRVGTEDFSGVQRCQGGCPDGQMRAVSIEGQITLTSVGRINPYFLVGLGVVQTTLGDVRVENSSGAEFQLSEVDVTDAGGNVGFGAALQLVGGLRLTAETRVSGSLPGAKDNAVTAFPFSLGLSYEF